MTPVITDPENFDVGLSDPVLDRHGGTEWLRLGRNREYQRIELWRDTRYPGVEDHRQIDTGMSLALDDVRWLRDRFNEILGDW